MWTKEKVVDRVAMVGTLTVVSIAAVTATVVVVATSPIWYPVVLIRRIPNGIRGLTRRRMLRRVQELPEPQRELVYKLDDVSLTLRGCIEVMAREKRWNNLPYFQCREHGAICIPKRVRLIEECEPEGVPSEFIDYFGEVGEIPETLVEYAKD